MNSGTPPVYYKTGLIYLGFPLHTLSRWGFLQEPMFSYRYQLKVPAKGAKFQRSPDPGTHPSRTKLPGNGVKISSTCGRTVIFPWGVQVGGWVGGPRCVVGSPFSIGARRLVRPGAKQADPLSEQAIFFLGGGRRVGGLGGRRGFGGVWCVWCVWDSTFLEDKRCLPRFFPDKSKRRPTSFVGALGHQICFLWMGKKQ